MTNPFSICEYCIHGLEHLVPDYNNPDLQMFVNAITEIVSIMNQFDKSKYLYAVCDQRGNIFDTCLVLKNANIPQLYLKLLLLGKRFVHGLCWLDPVGNKHNNDLNVVCEVSLAELDALETLENFSYSHSLFYYCQS